MGGLRYSPHESRKPRERRTGKGQGKMITFKVMLPVAYFLQPDSTSKQFIDEVYSLVS